MKADVQIDEHSDGRLRLFRRIAQDIGGERGIDRDAHGAFARQLGDALRSMRVQGRIANQQIVRCLPHHFRLTHFGDGEPAGAVGDLPPGHFDRLMRLGMRPQRQLVLAAVFGQPRKIPLDGVRIDHHGRRGKILLRGKSHDSREL